MHIYISKRRVEVKMIEKQRVEEAERYTCICMYVCTYIQTYKYTYSCIYVIQALCVEKVCFR
jgi:hypothetical protein